MKHDISVIPEEIIEQIDTLYHYFRNSRSFFPYLNPNLVGKTTSPLFNISKNIKARINFNEPITEDFLF